MTARIPRALPAALLVAALFAPAPAFSQATAGADRLAAMDVFELETAGDPQISTDGRRIVYVREYADVMSDRRYSNLWIVNADGTGHRALTSGKHRDSSPRWSPDGTRLLYVSTEGGSPQLHVRWMDTGATSAITNVTEAPGSPAWSPDGEQVAFTMLVPGRPRRIADMPEPPEGAQWEKPARVLDRLVYQFNGVGELEPGWSHVFVVPAEGGTPRQVTSGDFHHGGGAGRGGGDPVWAPDGRSLLISANRSDDWEMERRENEIWEFPLDGAAPRALTDRRGPDNTPAVSPDGRRIAYVGHDDARQGYSVSSLWVMDREGGGARALTASLDRDPASPAWASDGGGVYFTYDDQGTTKLGFVPAGGGEVRVVATDLGSGGSSYSGGAAFSLARDGTIAFTQTDAWTPGDIAVTRGRGGEARRVTAVNQDLLGARTLGEVEEIWYESSVDGRRVHGWIVKPPNFDPSRKYPLILEIHGGPFANYGPRFDLEKQIWAAEDFVVLYTNPRGSTSYGQEFGNLIHHAYPGDDYFDLISGVDAVIERGYVDPDRLFVTGGSGGGVLTAWVIGRTDRFRAAAAAYPVINWYSFNLTSDIPYINNYWFPGPPWEHAEHYMERSVISLAPEVETPTMIITGEEDWRTPMSESEQYYQALKIAGVEAVLVKVPDEPHGIRRYPSHHVAKILNILGWFQEHDVRGETPRAGG